MIHIINDRNVLHKLKQKDEAALEWIIDHYAPYVSTIVYNIIGTYLGTADVEEVSSDVFFALWTTGERIENGKLKAYLSAIARNKAKEKLRSMGHELLLEDDTIFIASDDPEADMEEKKQSAFLRRSILAMGIPDKEIFLRYYYYCQSVAQIAQEMDIAASTIKIRLYRGRKKLKHILFEGGYFVENENNGYDG